MKRNSAYKSTKHRLNLNLLRNRGVALVIAVGTVCLLAWILLGLHARAYSGKASPPRANATRAEAAPKVLPTPMPGAARGLQDDGPSVKLVTLGPGGFEPRELTSSKNRFILMIDNLTGLDDILIQLYRSGAGSVPRAKIHEVSMPGGRINWTNLFELDPGEYLLTEARHPGWDCKLTVRN
jgi:hypothetical protein